MKNSQIRNEINSAIDTAENAVSNVLDDLKSSEDVACKDADELTKDEIIQLQDAVIEAIKDLKEIKDALW